MIKLKPLSRVGYFCLGVLTEIAIRDWVWGDYKWALAITIFLVLTIGLDTYAYFHSKPRRAKGKSLNILADYFAISRIYYEKPCKESTNEMAYAPITGTPLGYPETDTHLRERIHNCILGPGPEET